MTENNMHHDNLLIMQIKVQTPRAIKPTQPPDNQQKPVQQNIVITVRKNIIQIPQSEPLIPQRIAYTTLSLFTTFVYHEVHFCCRIIDNALRARAGGALCDEGHGGQAGGGDGNRGGNGR